MKLDIRGPNCHELSVGAVLVLFSYGTPVGLWMPGVGPRKTTTKHSTTTSGHVNKWLREFGSDPETVGSVDATEMARVVLQHATE
jgi:hypothetical protein